jgi:hypothetical protein
MNLIAYLADSRGVVNSMQRIPTIAQRFGWSTNKMDKALNTYADIAEAHKTVPTLAVTANLLERYPRVFRGLADRGVELAIHGYVHTDYSRLGYEKQKEHLEKGLAAFQRLNIAVNGFRCPYVRWNNDSVLAAKALGLEYSSNRTFFWDVLPSSLPERSVDAYRKGLCLYGTAEAAHHASLPLDIEGLIDLPASMPDDEAMVDRLRLDPDLRAATWSSILDHVFRRGELFVVILHHERLALCAPALEALLERARRLHPDVWIAPMRDIAAWSQRRAGMRLRVEPASEGAWLVDAPDDAAATVVGRGVTTDSELRPWTGRYSLVPRSTEVRCRTAPWVVVDEDASASLVHFLEEEGYVVRRGKGAGGVRVKGFQEFGETDKRAVIDAIEADSAPVVRLSRWPRGARCALSLTGDVDSMTLLDFVRRPLEV